MRVILVKKKSPKYPRKALKSFHKTICRVSNLISKSRQCTGSRVRISKMILRRKKRYHKVR